jgi:hypothetical protein
MSFGETSFGALPWYLFFMTSILLTYGSLDMVQAALVAGEMEYIE